MTVQVIGAGLGRTGTLSLKVALERLLGGPCYQGFRARSASFDVEPAGEKVGGP